MVPSPALVDPGPPRWGDADLRPIELLHPDGVAKHVIALGGVAQRLWPSALPGVSPDLLLLGPTAAECANRQWLQTAARSARDLVAADGIVYVLAPPGWRARIRSLLIEQGLSMEQPVLHLPNWEQSRLLVPLDPLLVRYALSTVALARPWLRRLAVIACRFPGALRLLGHVLHPVGLIARRPGARPLFDWLRRLDGERCRPRGAVVSLSWRGPGGPIVVHRFSGRSPRPSAVAKIGGTGRGPAEASALARLGPRAREAGARVPKALGVGEIGGRTVRIETTVSGRPVATLLAARPGRCLEVVERLTSWLERWNGVTRVVGPAGRDRIEREILAPATLLAPDLPNGSALLARLAALCSSAEGISLPSVATHNDLTMWNVLLDDHGALGVIDWDTAREDGLPLADFFYAVTDAVAATAGYADREAAFDACFVGGGAWSATVTRLQRRLSFVTALSARAADLCFHACWLGHAANEHRARGPSGPRPFLGIARRLALLPTGAAGHPAR